MTTGWLVLDVDDTLVDTRRTGLAKIREVAAGLGLPRLDRTDFDAVYGTRPFRACVESWFPGTDVDAFCTGYDRLATAFPPVALCDGARVVARARAAGMGVGVLTNGPGRKTAAKLAAVGLADSALDFVCHADNWPVPKPDPDSFARLATFGVPAGRAWYVSDAAVDCRGSRAAGLRTIGVAGGPSGRGAVPDLVLSRAALLETVVDILCEVPPRTASGDPRAVGFDVGFTLVRDRVDAVDMVSALLGLPDPAVRQAFAAHDHLLADRAAWASDESIDRMLHAFYGAVLGEPASADVVTDLIARYTAPENWTPLPGAAEMLRSARRFPVGVLSNWQSGLERVLTHTGLRDALDAVVVSSAIGAAKPAPAAFTALAGALGVAVGDLVYVGDDPGCDAAGILRCGGRAVLVDRAAAADERTAAVAMALPW